MKRALLLFFFLSLSLQVAWATHNRAGEITYRHLGNLTYEIIITTFTDPASSQADRCTLDVDFGDGFQETVYRSNGGKSLNLCSQYQQAQDGEIIKTGIKKNVYRTTHTYAGPGVYVISMLDPNRVENIQNIPNSVSIPFFLKSTLVISATAGNNSSPKLTFLPVDRACVQTPFYHNPGAIDPEGDSLSYSLSVCYGDNGNPINGYVNPDQVDPGPNNNLTIDAHTGTLSWIAPPSQGEYNVCILIEEWRTDSLSGQVIKVGDVLRDMQISVGPCQNDVPVFDPLNDICVIAGDTLLQEVKVTDPGDLITLTATGSPFELSISPAEFDQPSISADSILDTLVWNTQCEHIRKSAYQITFKAEDNKQLTPLVNFESLFIRVVGPPSETYSATPIGNSIRVDWSANPCDNAVGYRIYRRKDSTNFLPSACVTGVPPSTGYQLVDFVSGFNNNSYLDTDKGKGLLHGHKYCYMVTAVYPDGAESIATGQFCAELRKDVPVITRVSVNQTSTTSGSDSITWAKPTELDDSVQFTGPYYYNIYRRTAGQSGSTLIGVTDTVTSIDNLDTVWVDFNLNTQENQYEYRVELISIPTTQGVVGLTQWASSVWASTSPLDEALTISWNFNVPWTNSAYEVYRLNPDSGMFELLDTVNTQSYLDTALKNGVEYCYKIRSIGSYSTKGFIDPILNFSQETCGIPEDTVKPCNPPDVVINAACDLDQTYLNWQNPNQSCADDVAFYRIYFTPELGGEYEFLYETANSEETSFERLNQTSIAGCYAITSIDSSGNESNLGEKFCVDNCPNYELPNVFTPGGDGFNDFFVPFPYKYVESIDLKIYNRWGNLVFQTTNPDIQWDGTDITTGEKVVSGTYFYVCDVNEIRLTGIETRTLKGNVTILNQAQQTPVQN